MILFQNLTSFKVAQPSLACEPITLIPKHLNLLNILSSTSQCLIACLFVYPALDLSSHRIAQRPNSPHEASFDPTNCHTVGPSVKFDKEALLFHLQYLNKA